MQTVSAQIKVNLPLPLQYKLRNRADILGLPMSTYVKHLIIADLKETDFPTYFPSALAEKKYLEAKKCMTQGLVVDPQKQKDYFKKLIA